MLNINSEITKKFSYIKIIIHHAGATKEIEDAINELPVDEDVKEKIYNKNIMNLINKKK